MMIILSYQQDINLCVVATKVYSIEKKRKEFAAVHYRFVSPALSRGSIFPFSVSTDDYVNTYGAQMDQIDD